MGCAKRVNVSIVKRNLRQLLDWRLWLATIILAGGVGCGVVVTALASPVGAATTHTEWCGTGTAYDGNCANGSASWPGAAGQPSLAAPSPGIATSYCNIGGNGGTDTTCFSYSESPGAQWFVWGTLASPNPFWGAYSSIGGSSSCYTYWYYGYANSGVW